MSKPKNTPAEAAELRRRAEKRLQQQETSSARPQADQDLRRLVHELQVHQVELEMQNEELRQARQEIDAGLEKYTDLYDSAPVGYLTLDRNGTIRQVNLAGARLLETARAGLEGTPFGFLVSDEVRLAFGAFLKQAFESHSKESCESVLCLKSVNHPLHVHIEAKAAEDGQACRVVVMDITQQTQAQEALAQSEARYRAAEEKAWRRIAQIASVSRLNVMGEMAASLAHELNQPLCSISASAQAGQYAVERIPPDLSLVSRSLSLIADQGRLAGEIIARVRAFAGRVEVAKTLTDANDVIRDAVVLLAHEMERQGVTATLALAEELPHTLINRIEIEQVILNLARNGIEAMLDTCPGQRTLHITSVPANGGTIEICVRDNGYGLSEEILLRLFSPFFTTKQNGMGMGLAISRSIIEAHAGHLTAISNPEGGSTFRVTLPVPEASGREVD